MRVTPLLVVLPTLWVGLAFASPLKYAVPFIPTSGDYGTLLANTSGSGTASGAGVATPFSVGFTESVYRGGRDAECPTCLSFVYDFTNTAPMGYDAIESMTTSSFSGYEVAAGYALRFNGTEVPPTDYSEDDAGTVTFDFLPPDAVRPGSETDDLILFTNAKSYKAGNLSFQDGTTLNEIGLGFEPSPAATAVTPEPSSLLLLGTGILGMTGVLRRRLS